MKSVRQPQENGGMFGLKERQVVMLSKVLLQWASRKKHDEANGREIIEV